MRREPPRDAVRGVPSGLSNDGYAQGKRFPCAVSGLYLISQRVSGVACAVSVPKNNKNIH
jgi:hypothetical protein